MMFFCINFFLKYILVFKFQFMSVSVIHPGLWSYTYNFLNRKFFITFMFIILFKTMANAMSNKLLKVSLKYIPSIISIHSSTFIFFYVLFQISKSLVIILINDIDLGLSLMLLFQIIKHLSIIKELLLKHFHVMLN